MGIDLTNFSFDGLNIVNKDFTNSLGAKINPQLVANKNCYGTCFTDAKITGPFDDVDIRSTIFKGSTGAQVNPQSVKNKNCYAVCFADAKITSSFDNCNIEGASFKGSTGAKIDLKKIRGDIYNIDFEDAEFINYITLNKSLIKLNFKGSKNAIIEILNPWVNISDCNLSDVCINAKNIDEVLYIINANNNISSNTTKINGLSSSEYLEKRNRLYNSYLNELDNFKLSLKN